MGRFVIERVFFPRALESSSAEIQFTNFEMPSGCLKEFGEKEGVESESIGERNTSSRKRALLPRTLLSAYEQGDVSESLPPSSLQTSHH